jgi:autotransporter-associated beta strand protein
VTLGVAITAHNLTFNTSGYIVTGNTLTLGGASPTIDVLSGTSATISSVIAGTAGLTKGGLGTLTLSGTNTYTGGTTINAGTLSINSNARLGNTSGGVTFGGGTLQSTASFTSNRGVTVGAGGGTFNTSSGTLTLGGVITGTGPLTKSGTGTLTLTADSPSFTGTTTVSAGTLQIGGGAATGSIAGDIVNNSALVFNRTGTLTYGGAISGSGTVTKSGAGTLTLTGINTYLGTTTISANGGTLQGGAENAFSANSAHTLNANTTLDLGGFDQIILSLASAGGAGTRTVTNSGITAATLTTGGSASTTFSGVIQDGVGATGLIKQGTGTFTLSGANTYTGDTTINAGTLQGGVANAFSAASATTINTGGTLNLGGFAQTINAVSLAGGTLTNGQLTGAITSTGGTISTLGGSASVTTTSGTTTLSGTNTYSGATNVNGGTLRAATATDFSAASAHTVAAGAFLDLFGGSQTIGSLAGAGTVTNSNTSTAARTLTTGGNNASTTFSGGIQNGTNAVTNLTKTGSGTFTLSGSGLNTYSGATTISLNGGTLRAGAENAFSANSAHTLNANTTLDLGGFDQIIGSLASTGGVGTVTNSGSSGATLTVGGDNTSTTFSGVIQDGAGGISLIKVGTGVFSLSGANTYSGGTTLAAGTLRLENNLALGSGALTTTGSVVDYADGVTIANPIVVNSNTTQLQVTTGTATQSGAISELNGPRPVEKIGAGTLILTAANTYSGPTTISAGTLQLGNGGTGGSILGNVVNNGILAINRSDNFTLANVISGTGGFQQNGAGATTLTATNTYTGATTVNAGALIVNGSIANSAVTVNAGALLAGTGTVGATTILSGGMFAPGPTSTPGSMTVQGNLAFQSGALYLVQVSPSTASSSNVTTGGSAALAGTVNAAFAGGSYVTRSYTILSTTGGLGGTTFNSLTTTNLPAGFTANLSYTASDVILNLTATLGQPSGPSGPGALGTGGLSQNQQNVANALNNFFNSGGTLPPAFLTIFGLTGANLANALTLLSGEAATGGQQVAFQLTNQFLGIMLDPFVDGRRGIAGTAGPALGFAPQREDLPEDIALVYAKLLKAPVKPANFDQRWSVWGAGYGGSNRTTGDPAMLGSHDLAARTAGGTAGLDYHLSRDSVVGFALAGGGTDWSLAQGLGGGKSDAFQAGVYGATRWGPAYLAAAFAYTNHWMSTDRFAVAGDHLTASFNAQSFGGRVEGGYRFATIYGGLTPYAAIQAQSFHTPSYSETDLTGGGFALAFNSRSATDTRSELGARFDRLLLLNPSAALTMRARAAWAHDWVSDPSLVPVFQTLPGASFIVNGATPAKNSALTSAGAELRLANGVTLTGKFDGEFASHSSTYAGSGMVRYMW